ncbi:unnamed protein product, partial [Rotaria magnacalcarata]
NRTLVSYCHRGIAALHGVNETKVCLCPPNYFGTQCQWQNQCISLTLQFIWRNLTSTHVIFQAIIMLIDEYGHVTPNYEQITYVHSRDCDTKFNIYLLYPNRPKNLTHKYSIRIDLFEKTILNYWQDSFCLASFICVCPLYKFGSRCYLKHSICQLSHNPCQHNGICVPNDDRIDLKGFTCICSQDYSGSRCENINNRIEIYLRDTKIQESSLLFIHFITAFKNVEHQRITLLKKVPYNRHGLTLYVSQPFNILLLQIPNGSYYLGILRETFMPSEHIHTEIKSQQRCLPISTLLNNTIINSGYLNRTKYYPLLCRQNRTMMCFYDNDLICICDLDRFSNCFSFNHTMNYDCQGHNYCENGGQCFQNNETCPTKSTCVCQDCYYGTKCQSSTRDFLFSLDPILGYHVKPNISINEQPFIIKISIVFSTIIFIFGCTNGVLSVIIFHREKPREVGSGYYLLVSSITSICMFIMLIIKFWQLILSQMFLITSRPFLNFSCVSLDFLLKVF